MATRAESFRAQQERSGKKAKKKKSAKKAPKRKARVTRTAAKASYALEEHGTKRPSRKSTRGSANRIKPDAGFNITEEVRRGSPERKHDRAAARAKHPRGKKR